MDLSRPIPAAKGKYIIINKAENRLYFYDNQEMIKKYKVATGKQDKLTPEGKFKVVNKIINPDNPLLGSRWMGLNTPGHKDGTKYGIHGTNEPESIGGHKSGGCIRMGKKDVEEIFPNVPIGTPVRIYRGSKVQKMWADFKWENLNNINLPGLLFSAAYCAAKNRQTEQQKI
ncbi:MAG: L,D-transpeptidase [Clostridiales bacterium]|nr:L,D-transpeptidase [Clostridiales bacterium]MCF8022372.1 L,D-transpeptidase [Clostridiales bacterium]